MTLWEAIKRRVAGCEHEWNAPQVMQFHELTEKRPLVKITHTYVCKKCKKSKTVTFD